MLTHKKFWVFRNGIDNAKYASAFSNGTIHGSAQSCTDCHGGTDGTAVRATAHSGNGWQRIPGPTQCAGCHATAVNLAATSLHTTVKGYEPMLQTRGVDLAAGTTARARYDKQCTKCHVANDAGQSACGMCHVAVPDTAGGRLVKGHRFYKTPSTDENCTACHGSRVKDEYYGQNGALYVRNRTYNATLAAQDPFAGAPITADVHKQGAMGCEACHYAAEMHGNGVTAGVDRYGITGTPQCTDCHTPSTSVGLHTSGHLAAMDCRVCHSQQYKSCFGCHTQETAAGTGYFTNNDADPTRATRPATAAAYSATTKYTRNQAVAVGTATFKALLSDHLGCPPPGGANPAAWAATTTYAAKQCVLVSTTVYVSLVAANLNNAPATSPSAWAAYDAATLWVADLPSGDALMTFRVGKNPKFGSEPSQKKYAVLRHVPVDGRTFEYTDEGTKVTGLIPNLAALPTWKYATPHNIARVTPITTAPAGGTSCQNCHQAAGYARFWLTDPVADAFGWVPDPSVPANAEYQFEVDANAGVVQPTPVSPVFP